jgi:hypothetical protein
MVAKTDNPAVDLTVVAVSEDSSGNVADPFTGEDANPGILLFIERAPLKAGDRVTVTYGAGSGRAYASTFAGGHHSASPCARMEGPIRSGSSPSEIRRPSR